MVITVVMMVTVVGSEVYNGGSDGCNGDHDGYNGGYHGGYHGGSDGHEW